MYRGTVDKGKLKRLPPRYIFHEDRGRSRVWRRCGFGGYLSRETDDGVPPSCRTKGGVVGEGEKGLETLWPL